MGLLDRLFRGPSQVPDPQAILDGLCEFVTAATWADSRRILEQRTGQLSEEADAGKSGDGPIP